MHEQRLIVRLQSYWEMLKKDKDMPAIEQFNSHTVSDLWGKCLKIFFDYRSNNFTSYKYEHVGEETIEMMGVDLTGRTVDMRAVEFQGIKLNKHIDMVKETRKPQKEENQFSNARGELIKYRCCFLPFGDDKRGVTHIIIGMSYRVFR